MVVLQLQNTVLETAEADEDLPGIASAASPTVKKSYDVTFKYSVVQYAGGRGMACSPWPGILSLYLDPLHPSLAVASSAICILVVGVLPAFWDVCVCLCVP